MRIGTAMTRTIRWRLNQSFAPNVSFSRGKLLIFDDVIHHGGFYEHVTAFQGQGGVENVMAVNSLIYVEFSGKGIFARRKRASK